MLRRMAQIGDDLSKPRDVDYFFVFPDEKRAAEFAADVKKELGLDTETEENEESGFDATVTKELVPTHEAITQLEQSLVRIAKARGGRPEGWGCVPVVKAK